MRHMKPISRMLPAKAVSENCKTVPVTVEGGIVVGLLELLGYTVQDTDVIGVTELCKG